MLIRVWTLLAVFSLALASPVPAPALSSKDLIDRDLISKDLSKRSPLTDFLALLLDYLPAIDGTITAVSGVLTTFENFLAAITGESTTYNDLSGTCKAYTIIFAKGTTEPGNVGVLVGPPFFEAMKGKFGSANVAVQGVNGYDASVDNYLEGGDPAGGVSMASLITSAKEKCPNTKLVVSGYSQGGQVIHMATAQISAATAAFISKVVIFGDPYSHQAVQNVAASKVDVICHAGDNICDNGILVLPPHLTYGIDAAAAANFVGS